MYRKIAKALLEKENLSISENMNERQEVNKKKSIKKTIRISGGIFLLLTVVSISFVVLGKIHLKNNNQNEVYLGEAGTGNEEQEWQSGEVKYQGQVYKYNEDILTFLFMGIDKKEGEVEEVPEGTDGGQADALFLLVLNPHDKSASILAINRNTMTNIDIYDEKGVYVDTVTAQIAVQHGFGNGVEESCEYQVNAVKNLLYDIPIHGYCALNARAVVPVVDLIDGVEVTAIEDIYRDGEILILEEGEKRVLDGEDSYSYVLYRDINETKSADRRLERQKQWLTAFIAQVKSQTLKNILLPVKLYQEIEKYMVTDISLDELTYLAGMTNGYLFDEEHIYSLTGETVMGEMFEEFYADEKALYELLLNLFYEPIVQ